VWVGGLYIYTYILPPYSNNHNNPPKKQSNREVVEFIEEERGVRVAAPDEARFMVYTPPQLQRTDLKDLVIVQPEVFIYMCVYVCVYVYRIKHTTHAPSHPTPNTHHHAAGPVLHAAGQPHQLAELEPPPRVHHAGGKSCFVLYVYIYLYVYGKTWDPDTYIYIYQSI
jgi:hypothetical protein